MKLNVNSCDGIYDSLDVRFTKSCDNNCSFCIEKAGLDSLGKTNVNEIIKSTIDSGIKDVLILGGEPFLQPKKLLEYIEGIRNNVDQIYITTALPMNMQYKYEYTSKILKLINGLNVSLHSHINSENNLLLCSSTPKFNRIVFLENLLKKQEIADKIRVSINLTKNGINTKSKILTYLNHLQSIGCKHVKINELQHTPDEYINFEKIMGLKLPSPFASGCQTPIKIENINMKLTLKRSCFKVEDSLNASFSDFIKAIITRLFQNKIKNHFEVIYENGKRSTHWEKNER